MSRPARRPPPRWPWPPERCSPRLRHRGARAPQPAAEAPPAGAPSLDTSLVTAAGTWAVAVMGGSAPTHNNFWQLFARPAGSSRWKLVTPPGTADNGGLVLAGAGGGSLIAAFRPSQYLTYTPLTDHPHRRAGLVLAQPARRGPRQRPGRAGRRARDRAPARPARRRHRRAVRTRLHHLDDPHHPAGPRRDGRRPQLRAAGPHRRRLHPVRACPCSPAPAPPGTAGIFAGTDGTWQAAGPALPAALASQHIRCSGSPGPVSRQWRCSPQAPAQPPACSPPGPPTAAATGPSHPRSRCTARRRSQRPSDPAEQPRSC